MVRRTQSLCQVWDMARWIRKELRNCIIYSGSLRGVDARILWFWREMRSKLTSRSACVRVRGLRSASPRSCKNSLVAGAQATIECFDERVLLRLDATILVRLPTPPIERVSLSPGAIIALFSIPAPPGNVPEPNNSPGTRVSSCEANAIASASVKCPPAEETFATECACR